MVAPRCGLCDHVQSINAYSQFRIGFGFNFAGFRSGICRSFTAACRLTISI
jgi:hypothetical protein